MKGNVKRFLAGMLCAVMLFTSEGMSGMVCAASVSEVVQEDKGVTESETSSGEDGTVIEPGGETFPEEEPDIPGDISSEEISDGDEEGVPDAGVADDADGTEESDADGVSMEDSMVDADVEAGAVGVDDAADLNGVADEDVEPEEDLAESELPIQTDNTEGGEEEPPQAESIQIVDENGNPVEELTMTVGQQKVLSVKLVPEGSVVKTAINWSSSSSYLNVAGGVITAKKVSATGYTVTVKAGKLSAKCKIMVAEAPEEGEGALPSLTFGNVKITGTGLGTAVQTEENHWIVDIDANSDISLNYTGEEDPSQASVYYCEIGMMRLNDSGTALVRNNWTKRYKTPINVKIDKTLQVAATDSNYYLLDGRGICTVDFHVRSTEFLLESSRLGVLPDSEPIELAVKRLPDNSKAEDIEWSTSDARLVKLGEKTENGILLEVGHIQGSAQITARVRDHKGAYQYASCCVQVEKTVPTPSFESAEGGPAEISVSDEEWISCWLIDKGGRVAISVKGRPDAEIYYTLDGSMPTERSNRYTAPITVSKKTTITAFAKLEGYNDSSVAEEEFRIGTSRLSISPTAVTLAPEKSREISVKNVPTGADKYEVEWSSSNKDVAEVTWETEDTDDEDGVGREYAKLTANGPGKCIITASITDYADRKLTAECVVTVPKKVGTPVFALNEETGPTVSEYKTVKWTDEDGEEQEDEVETVYVIVSKGGTIEIQPAEGEGDDEVIYYTTDGSRPSASGKTSKKYTGPIKITKKCMVRAVASRAGFADSDEASVRYKPYDTGMTLSKTSVSLTAGKRQEISVTKWPTGEHPEIDWYSADGRVATVDTETEYIEVVGEDEDGEPIIEEIEKEHIYIAGIAGGKTQIIASYTDFAGNERTAVCNVTVAGKLAITQSVILTEGESKPLKVTKNQTGMRSDEIIWECGDAVMTLEDGILTADMLKDTEQPLETVVKAYVTVEGTDGEDTEIAAYCKVTVIPQTYTVSFIGWNGKTAKTELVYRGQSAVPPAAENMAAAAPAGWTFKSWQGNAWGNITEHVTVESEYETITYTITYDTQSGGTVPPDAVTEYTVESGNLPLMDAVSSREAYVFAGWYRDSGHTGSPVAEISRGSTGNVTLYARWIPANEGIWMEPIPAQPYTGKAIKPEVKVYDGVTLLMPGRDYTLEYKNNKKANQLSTDKEQTTPPTVIVKGKGNYTKSAKAEFKILPKDISESDGTVTADAVYMAYNKGNVLKPAPTVKWNGKKLDGKNDYFVKEIRQNGAAVAECREEGEYTIVIAGKGNYTGERTVPLVVTKKILISKASIGKIADVSWTGEPVDVSKIAPKLTYGKSKKKLIQGTDYTLSFDENAVDTGTYEVKITGIGDYAGVVTRTFKIKGKAINKDNLTVSGLGNRVYNGGEQTQTLSVVYGKGKNAVPLREGIDYTLTWQNHTNAGKKATAVITGKNGYTGTVKKTFTIKAYSLKDGYDREQVKISFAQAGPIYYEKGGVKPEVVVVWGDTELKAGVDYSLKYANNGKAAKAGDKKPPTITVTGKGNFSGSVSLTFTIMQQDISLASIAANDVTAQAAAKGASVGYTKAGKYKSTPSLTDRNGRKLAAGTDYKKSYIYTDENGNVLTGKDKVAAGSTVTVKVTGTGSYKGEISVSYRILGSGKSISAKNASVSLKKGTAKYYSGEPVVLTKEDLVVKIGKKELTSDDYTIVSYMNNVKKGTARVTIRGTGEYGGVKTISFSVKAREIVWTVRTE